MNKCFILIMSLLALSLSGCNRTFSIIDGDGDNHQTIKTPEDKNCPVCGKDLDDGDDTDADGDDDTDTDGDTDGDDTGHGHGKGHQKHNNGKHLHKGWAKHNHVCPNLHSNG